MRLCEVMVCVAVSVLICCSAFLCFGTCLKASSEILRVEKNYSKKVMEKVLDEKKDEIKMEQ